MRATSRGAAAVFAIAVTAFSFGAESTALAQDDDADPGATPRRERAVHETMISTTEQKNRVQYGVGLRLRYVFFPKSLIELFIEEASSGMGSPGFGLEFIYRKHDFQIHLGLEYENVSPEDGWWLEKGDDPGVPGQHPDFVEFDGLAWTTLDVEFVFLKELAPKFDLRYGAGFGLGIVHGDALQTDSTCPANVSDIQTQCMTVATGQVDDPADIPPVFPVVNFLIGAQYRPLDNVVIALQGGMRSVFYFGLGTSFYF
jgi:hypothetical protein